MLLLTDSIFPGKTPGNAQQGMKSLAQRLVCCALYCSLLLVYARYELGQTSVAEGGPAIYDMLGFVEHYGNMGFGHYTACARDLGSADRQWRRYDDSRVSAVKESELGFGNEGECCKLAIYFHAPRARPIKKGAHARACQCTPCACTVSHVTTTRAAPYLLFYSRRKHHSFI